MVDKVRVAMRKLASDWTPVHTGALSAGLFGVPTAVLDYIKSGENPRMRGSHVRRALRALSKGVLASTGGFIAGYGAHSLGEGMRRLSQGPIPVALTGGKLSTETRVTGGALNTDTRVTGGKIKSTIGL